MVVKRFQDEDAGEAGTSEMQSSCKKEKRFDMNYQGWVVPSKEYAIERIAYQDITPETFYVDYVKKRKPVVIEGCMTMKATELWKDNAYLSSKAGHEMLRIEQRASSTDVFGKGQKVSMSFAKFLEAMEAGEDSYYLTTQKVCENENGTPELMAPFLQHFVGDFPLRPEIMGHLIPQNINVWMGNNEHGSSTGLHHDYHDNLYVLLRGKKRFRLYSPIDTANLYPRGQVSRVHENGLINYVGHETTTFGADLEEITESRKRQERECIELEILLAEQAVSKGEDGAEERLRVAEEKLDALMDLELMDGMASHDGDDDSEEGDESDMTEEDGSEEETENVEVQEEMEEPLNFCTVDSTLDAEVFKKRFPLYVHAKEAFCDLNVGDMLYLPASWFHEVTSYGSNQGHLALNYWYHPPDNCAKGDLKEPYSDDYWVKEWESRHLDFIHGESKTNAHDDK